MKQIASLKAEMSLTTAALSISNSEQSPLPSNQATLSVSIGCSGKLGFRLLQTLAFGALLLLVYCLAFCTLKTYDPGQP